MTQLARAKKMLLLLVFKVLLLAFKVLLLAFKVLLLAFKGQTRLGCGRSSIYRRLWVLGKLSLSILAV